MFSNIILFECPFQNYKNQKTVESENNIKAIIYCLWCRYKYKAYSFIINLTFHLLSEMLCGFKFRTTFKVFTLSLKVVFLFASSLVFTVYYILWFFCRNFLLSIFKTILLKIIFIKMFTDKKISSLMKLTGFLFHYGRSISWYSPNLIITSILVRSTRLSFW